jgi:hypothetical protein
MKKIDLTGTWRFCLDNEKIGMNMKYYEKAFEDSMKLPGTVSTAKKGEPSQVMNTGFLTDPYQFEGYTWYSRTVEFSDLKGKEFFLILERTRVSHVWMDDKYVGSNNSLCTPHRYRLTPYINKQNKLTIMIDNTSYPVPGGHMTSKDTQTNWNGITGEIYIEECSQIYLTGVKIYPNAEKRLIEVKATLNGGAQSKLTVSVSDDNKVFPKSVYQLYEGENSATYYLDETAETWSEHTPKLYHLHLELSQNEDIFCDTYHFSFGLRDFKAAGKYFEINGIRTFLRGKHDGLLFPLTGHAPTDLESWLKVLGTAKEYGINHYRFHTCCPPEAAFAAADMLGIYMEPELPFWGTVTEEGEENHDEKAQQYLIKEGFRILDEYGNHPSFVMMSMGNELWGSKKRLNQILGRYREYDSRHLYTQGSNNFQFMPCILENEDFFCGVRFSKDRLFRGSYAMCDAPQGHIQTMPPNMIYNYDPVIRPVKPLEEASTDGEITIQFGTGTKTVKMDASQEIIPEIPVVSHEIGQYAMFPDFSEIRKYTGVLKARNLEVFQKCLEAKGMLSMAERFFQASGRFAAECYKAEIESALRSDELAGFQILDLQDFTGQGTALVGILNVFMENKGLISPHEWQQFCSETVILAELPKLIFTSGENVNVGIKLAAFQSEAIVNPKVELSILKGEEVVISEERIWLSECFGGVYKLCDFAIKLPETLYPQKLSVNIGIEQTDVRNRYDIWVYPDSWSMDFDKDILITDSIAEACKCLKQGKKVVLYPDNLDDANSIEGTYCTDFWCYSMFRSISESMGKPVPTGTLGLFIEKEHPIFNYFPTEYYTTAQWYDIVSGSRALILDENTIEPIVWSIDNFERNHKLGNIFETKVGEGKLLVCTSDLRKLPDSDPARWLEYSILQYVSSENFEPESEIGIEELSK